MFNNLLFKIKFLIIILQKFKNYPFLYLIFYIKFEGLYNYFV